MKTVCKLISKTFCTLSLVLSSVSALAETVVHPAPKDPIYVDSGIYSRLKHALTPPPKLGSIAQEKDESTLLNLQSIRSEHQCKAAKSEVFVSLENFFASPQGPLTMEEVKILSAFFQKIRNDSDFFIQKLKVDLPRKRPFLYIKDLKPCVPLEVTNAYPSGHATISKLYSLILVEIFEDRKKAFEARALEIGEHRILSGMHHPTDISAGHELAKSLFRELLASQKFQTELRLLRDVIKKSKGTNS